MSGLLGERWPNRTDFGNSKIQFEDDGDRNDENDVEHDVEHDDDKTVPNMKPTKPTSKTIKNKPEETNQKCQKSRSNQVQLQTECNEKPNPTRTQNVVNTWSQRRLHDERRTRTDENN